MLSNAISASSSYFPLRFLAKSFIFFAIMSLVNITSGNVTTIPAKMSQFIFTKAMLIVIMVTAYCNISGNISDSSFPISLISEVSLLIIVPSFFSKNLYCTLSNDSTVIFLQSFCTLMLKSSLVILFI